MARIAQAKSVADNLRDEAVVSRAELPIQIDDITTMSDISANGDTLTVIFDVSEPIVGFKDGFGASVIKGYCAPELFGDLAARDALIYLTYRGPDGGTIDTFTVSRETCGAA
jgi:hypothetical protein